MQLSKKSIDQIISFEVTSEEVYNKKYINPIWPGGDSGVTIGIGYDLGMNNRETIIMDWTGNVNLNSVSILSNLAGITGQKAKESLTPLVKSVVVPYSSAYNVFVNNTLPRFCKAALKVYPGLDKLNPDTQGAIVSLVYNRGNKLTGETRTEMAELVDLIAKQDYVGIASAIARMQRIWANKGLDGLLTRRRIESRIVLDSISNDLAAQYLDAHSYSI
jgi:hypothetical protein